jgi:hypothetical protein
MAQTPVKGNRGQGRAPRCEGEGLARKQGAITVDHKGNVGMTYPVGRQRDYDASAWTSKGINLKVVAGNHFHRCTLRTLAGLFAWKGQDVRVHTADAHLFRNQV